MTTLTAGQRAAQTPPYPPGGGNPGPGPTGPGPSNPGGSTGPGRADWSPPQPPPPPPPPPIPPLPPRYDDRLVALANPGMAIYPQTRRVVAGIASRPAPPAHEIPNRGGEVKDVQPPPAAAVLAGAESRRDSGPLILPALQERSPAPYCGWAPGDRSDPEDPILLPPRPPAADPQPLPPPPLPQPPDPPWPQPTAVRQPGGTHPSPKRPADTRPPKDPTRPPPDPEQPTATDGDGQIGGGGNCRRMAVLLLPVLPLLLPILFLAGLFLARPRPDGHHLGKRHETAPPEGSWTYDRPADTDPEPPGRHPRGVRTNLDPGEEVR